ncbi:MAG: CPBP family intramembrane glutamic endopeptidase [Gemmataceae bacterium]
MPKNDLQGLILFLIVITLPYLVFLVLPQRLRPHFPPSHIRMVPWLGAVVILCFLILFILHGAAADYIPQLKAIKNPWRQLVASAWFINPELVLVFLLLWPALPYSAPISAKRVLRNVGLGILTWSLITPAVVAIHFVVNWIWQFAGPVPEHALITELRLNRAETTYWALVAMEAVALAPLREELFFRGILQPWILQRRWGGDVAFALAAIAGFLFVGDVSWKLAIQPVIFVFVVVFTLSLLERLLPAIPMSRPRWWRTLFPPLAHGIAITGAELRRGIVGVSVLFAMLHAQSWPDPIALTVLGIGLGWLAWRTQSLAAPVVCHALFNVMSLAQLRFGSAP